MRRRNVPCSPCGSGSSDCGCCPPKSIKKINNIEPDDNGKFEVRAGTNVTITDITNGIEISSAGSVEDVVKTVNGVSPDADGEVTITAGSNITITPDAGTNSIEIEASVPTVDAVAPIYIDNDGKINLAEWDLVDYYDWTGFVSNAIIQEDLLILVNNISFFDDMYLPKGYVITDHKLNALGEGSANSSTRTEFHMASILLTKLFNAGSSISMEYSGVVLTKSGSGLNEKLIMNNHSYSSTLTKLITSASGNGIKLFKRKVPQ